VCVPVFVRVSVCVLCTCACVCLCWFVSLRVCDSLSHDHEGVWILDSLSI